MRSRFILTFDVSDDKLRAKLVKILEEFGIRLQYSVFEFLLTPARELEFFGKLKNGSFLSEQEGVSILIIPICEHDAKKMIRIGKCFINIFDDKVVML